MAISNSQNVPSKAWYPTKLQDRAAWHQNWTTQLAILGAGLGVTAPEIAQQQDDNTVMQFLAQTDVDFEAYGDAIREYRINITQGNPGEPTPSFPADPGFALPEVVPTGIFRRLIDLVERIRTAATYTPEAGALLGIIPNSGGGPVPESELKPSLKVSTEPGNVVVVKFTRGKTDGIGLEMKIDNEANWSNAGRFPKSPAIITVPANGGLPRSVQLRARFLDGNTPVGQNSDTVTVVTTP